MSSLRDWLQANGLERHSDSFHANGIDLDVIASLTDADLRELGLNLGDRRRFLAAIAGPRNAQAPNRSGLSAALAGGERRQLTVLFCDMVGFTELASRLDPEVLQTIVRIYEDACAAAITRYEGYVFQRLGDGIVAFFGYPLAHEGEAERAIRAGLDIVAAFSKLEVPEAGHLSVRIGIATGMVVVSSAEKGAVGETMNLASRLQGIAPVNTIVVSERVQRLVGGAFECEDLGEQTLKGIAKPTHAYRVLGINAAANRFEAAHAETITSLVGREREIALLLDRWRQACDGEGQVVLLSGEPGIGKSRILNALRKRLTGEPFNLLSSQCSPFYANTAFYPIADQMARAAGFERHDDADAKLDKLERLFARLGFNLPEIMPLFAAALSIPCGERYPPLDMSPQRLKDRTVAALAERVVMTSQRQPVLFVVEDLHWSDPTSIEVLGVIVDLVRDARVLVVCTFRPEFDPPWSGHVHVTSLNLSKLTRAQSSAIISELAGGKALPADLVEQILNRTDGVPLFVEELTKSILESGELKDTGDRYDYAGTSRSVTIPATLRDSLMARLDRYMPVKEVAQIGAAIGREFSYELVSAVAPMVRSKLDEALEQLTDSGLAFRKGIPPDATYTFKHALVQDSAYDSLLKKRRQELHGKIAFVIQARFPDVVDSKPELLAHHLTGANKNAAAIVMWRKAGELSLDRMALTEAISHFNRGLELVPKLAASLERDANELELRVPMGMAWLALNGWPAPEVWNSLHPALPLAKSLGRNVALLPILWGLRANVHSRGRVAEALPWAQEMLGAAQETGDPNLLISAQIGLCVCYFWLGKLTESLEHEKNVMAIYDADKFRHIVDLVNHDPKTSALVYASQATWMLGFPERALRLGDEAVEHARLIGHPFDLGFALHMDSLVHDYRDEPEEMRQRAMECERLGRENSLPVLFEVLAPDSLAIALIKEGSVAQGLARRKNVPEFWRNRTRGNVMYTRPPLIEAMVLSEQYDDAQRLIDAQIEQIERPGWEQRVHYAEILRVKGWMLGIKADLAGAEKYYLASLDWAREQKSKSWELRTSTSLARLWQQQGKHRDAHELLAPVYNWFTEGFDTKDLKEARALLEELEVTA